MSVLRPGKTQRDKLSGAYARHLRNMELRRRWNQEYMRQSKAGGRTIVPYPKIGQ